MGGTPHFLIPFTASGGAQYARELVHRPSLASEPSHPLHLSSFTRGGGDVLFSSWVYVREAKLSAPKTRRSALVIQLTEAVRSAERFYRPLTLTGQRVRRQRHYRGALCGLHFKQQQKSTNDVSESSGMTLA